MAMWAVSWRHLAIHTIRRYRISMLLTPMETGPIQLGLSCMTTKNRKRSTERRIKYHPQEQQFCRTADHGENVSAVLPVNYFILGLQCLGFLLWSLSLLWCLGESAIHISELQVGHISNALCGFHEVEESWLVTHGDSS